MDRSTYTPNENFCGTDSFTYKVTDGECDPMYQDEATVTIDVACANDCPVAMDDAYDATEDTPLTEPAPGVLGNDYDPDGDEITVASYTQPSSGTVEMNPDGSFTYTPNENYCGTDSFTYKVTDGECDPMYQDEATVTIDVACVSCEVTGSDTLTFDDKKVDWQITNYGDDPLTISSIYLEWPESNKKLMKVKLDGVEIFSPDLSPTSATIDSGWKGSISDRTIGAGETSTLRFEFERSASSYPNDYVIKVQFGPDCELNFEPVPLNFCDVTGSDTLTFDDKKVDWQIVNYGDRLIISSIYLQWPASNKKLMKVKLDGVEIFSPDLSPTSATIDSGWKGSIGDRTIGVGETSTLRFEFESSASVNPNDYVINLQFGPDCGLQFVPGPWYPDFCDIYGKPQALTMRYTGESCDATDHSQDPSKVTCSGDPQFASPVHIVAGNRADLTDKIWFDGTVDLDETFVIDATNAGANSLSADTCVSIFDASDELLQQIRFHTSCSQPLLEGDQFGSLVLVGFTPEL